MTKKLNGYTKFMVWVAGIVFGLGIIYATISFNTEKIDEVKIASTQNREDIIGMKRDISHIKEGVDILLERKNE